MFDASVERWRGLADNQAAWASQRYGVAVDGSDLLALVKVESGGNAAAVSPTGYRGLGQVGEAALSDYNNSDAGKVMPATWEQMRDPEAAHHQLRVVAWLVANGRRAVAKWGYPDSKTNAVLWADARYAWGGGNIKAAVAEYQATHDGASPTFAQLAAFKPDAGKPNVRPWHHAIKVRDLAVADRGGVVPAGRSGVVLGLFVVALVVVLLAYALR